MLKALMPVAVFGVGCVFGTESFTTNAMANMIVVTIGVAIASYGEINLVWVGVFLQLLSVATESTRLTLVPPPLPPGPSLPAPLAMTGPPSPPPHHPLGRQF